MGHQNVLSNRQRSPFTAARIFTRVAMCGVMAASCAALTGPAAAQGATSPAVTTPTGDPYKACFDGTSNEDRTTCMKEAGAAKAEAQRGQLTNAGGAFASNALQRCDALPSDQKEACRLRILGAGTTSGSVAGGGIVREVTTQNPTGPAPMPSTTSGTGSSMDGAGSSPR